MDILLGIGSVCHLGRDIDNLRDQSRVLEHESQHLQQLLDACRRNQMLVSDAVIGWLRRADEVGKEVVQLLQEGELLLGRGCCPPNICWSSYNMGYRIAKKIEEVDQLIHQLEGFHAIARQAPTPPPVPVIAKKEMPVRLNSTLSSVWSSLKIPHQKIIGIVGTRGVGKTTLLRGIYNKLLKTNDFHFDFHVFIWAGVNGSYKYNVHKIQDDIRIALGLPDYSWKNKTPKQRRRDLFHILSDRKFVLLLDDLCDPFEFKKIGVPLPHNNNFNPESKVVFTTRSSDVCAAMNANSEFTVNVLSEADGWELFSQAVEWEETLNSNPRIHEVAMEIVKECQGVPIAILNVGRAMAGKTNESEWRYLLTRLRTNSPNALNALEKSYHHFVEDKVSRSCLRYCCLLREGYAADSDQLIDYLIGEGPQGLLDGKEARNQGHTIIERLKSINLLMGEGSSTVEMHPLIRNMLLPMVAAEEKILAAAGDYLTEAPGEAEWGEALKISLMDNQIEELSGYPPSCTNLVTLILSKSGLKTISPGFFQHMESLKVLDLSWCEIGKIPLEIVDLSELQYLNLSHTNINTLPTGFEKLQKLKVLDLSYTGLTEILRGTIEALSSLQVLNMFCCWGYDDWIIYDCDFAVGGRGFVEELEHMKLLNHLGISITEVQALERLEVSREVQGSTHSLLFKRCKGLTSLRLSSLRFMVWLRILEISGCDDLVQISLGMEELLSLHLRDIHFYSLQHVKIQECWLLEALTWLSFVPNLQTLDIERCVNLRFVVDNHSVGVAEGGGTPSMFPKLKRICLTHLPNLSCISRTTMSFPLLEEIRVSYCRKMKKFPVDYKSCTITLKLIEGQGKWWKDLEDENINKELGAYFREIQ